MKTILILTHTNGKQSIYSSYVFYHAKALAELGNKVIVLAINNYFPLIRKSIKKEVVNIDNVEIHFLNRISVSNFLINSKLNINGFLYYIVALQEIKKIFQNNKIDLIDAHYFKVEGYAAYRIKKKLNIKTFITLHGTSFNNSYHSINGKKEIIKISKTIDYFVCVSEKIQRMLDKLDIHNSRVIYNGINFYPNKEIEKNNHSIITVGSFTSDKNIDIVINSFKIVLKEFPDTELTIIGTGPLKNELINLSTDIQNNVLFTGQLENKDVYKYLNKSDVFILPSSPEGFGIVYAEAMYNKCITIGTKNEGIDGFIQNGKNGFLVSVNDLEIANLIMDIFNNKYNLNSIRQNAYNDAKTLTWKKNAKEYMKLITSISNVK